MNASNNALQSSLNTVSNMYFETRSKLATLSSTNIKEQQYSESVHTGT